MLKLLKKYYYEIIFIAITVLSVGGYFLYRYQAQAPFDAWYFVPEDPVFIVESKDLVKTYQSIQAKAFWKSLTQTKYFKTANTRLETTLKFLYELQAIPQFFQNKTFLASIHSTSKDNFDAIFYIPLTGEKDKDLFGKLLAKFKQNPDYSFATRKLSGLEVVEVSNQNDNILFSFTLHREYLIASYTPVLLEDVIRKIRQGLTVFELKNQDKLDKLWKDRNTSIYINTPQLGSFMRILSNKNFTNFFEPLGNFASHLVLSPKFADEILSLEGLAQIAKEDSSTFLNIFHNQDTKTFTLKKLIPQNTAILYQMTYSYKEGFVEALRKYWQAENGQFLKKQKQLEQKYKFKFSKLYKTLDEEIAYCILERSNRNQSSKVLLWQSKESNQSIDILKNIGLEVNQVEGIKNYAESYRQYYIRELGIGEFPAYFLGDMFLGFRECYYVAIGQNIVMGNSLQSIKTLIDQARSNKTFAYLDFYKKYMDKSPTNFGIYINTNKAWNMWSKNASPVWKKLMQNYELNIKSFREISLSFDYKAELESDYFEAVLNIDFKKTKRPVLVKNKGLEPIYERKLARPIYTQPFLVKNHNTGQREVLVQDFENNLYLLNQKGQILWKTKGFSPISSDLTQVDIYNNQKLQYFFTTSDRIQLIDRLGRLVAGFPVRTGDTTRLNTLSVFYPDNSGKFYFTASDVRGKAYIWDSQRKSLKNWRPKKFDYQLGTPMQYLKIRGKDYILTAQVNGLIYLFDIKGKLQAGFPLATNHRIANPIQVEQGLELGKTLATCITVDGKLLRFNLLGKILEDTQLYRPSAKASFLVCQSPYVEEWLIAIVDRGYVGLLDKKGQIIFEKKYDTKSRSIEVQYFDFGESLRVVAVTDKITSQTYLYDFKGKPIVPSFKSNKAIALEFLPQAHQLLIYRTYRNTLAGFSLRLE